MSEPEKNKEYSSIEELRLSPQGVEVRRLASEITDIVFDIKAAELYPVPSLDSQKKQSKLEDLNKLLLQFRNAAEGIIGTIPESDDDLYNQIIQPLVTSIIDNTA